MESASNNQQQSSTKIKKSERRNGNIMLNKQFPSSLSPAVAFKVMIIFCVNVKGYPVKAYLGRQKQKSKPLSLENY